MTDRLFEIWSNADPDTIGAFLEFAPVMMHSTDRTGCIGHVSGLWASRLGYEKHEMIGRRLPDLMTDESKYRALTVEIPRFIRTGRSQNVEYDFVRKDGIVFPALLSSIARYDEDGHFCSSVAVICDNTANKYLKKFEHEVEKAERENNAKTRFLANMSHELRTPLNAIIGFAQMIHGQAGPINEAQQVEYSGYIMQSSDRLLKLINQVLDLSSIEAGGEALTLHDVDVRSVIDEVLTEASVLAQPRNITLINDVADMDLPLVRADRERLTQTLVNLVANAVKYNRQNGEVRVSAKQVSSELRIEVADTGPGIAANRHTEVFETFNRLGAEGTNLEGSGVGLALAKEYIEKMGGSIGYSSEVGVGSTFWLELLLATPSATPIEHTDIWETGFPSVGPAHRVRNSIAS